MFPNEEKIQIGRFWSKINLPKKSIDCLRQIEAYYTEEKIGEILYAMVKNRFDISRRTLEYTCVNYAKKENIIYPWFLEGEEVVVHVADQYDRWLDQWNRRNFDFFRRYTRIFFEYRGEILQTTVGQAHIMFWADKYGVIDYVRRNLDKICSDMSETHGKNRRDKQKYKLAGQKRKRQKLVSNPKGQCFIYEMKVRLNFNDNYSNKNPDVNTLYSSATVMT